MIAGISSDGSGGARNTSFQSLSQSHVADSRRARITVAPPTGVAPTVSDEAPSEIDSIASVVTNALVSRIYDAAGLSSSLTRAQHIQAGEIDTRR